jgi:cytoskeletal protein CcmA (bactofilin family)
MFGSKAHKPHGRIDSLIGAGTAIEGNLTFTGGLRIDGSVRGDVVATGEQPAALFISEQARIEGQIRAAHVVINGTVVGSVRGTHYVELQSKARVSGDVHYRTLEIQLGAVVQGHLVHQEASTGQKVVALKQGQSQQD